MVKHDEMMYPIIPHKYDIGFIARNCDFNLLKELEPWCSNIYIEYTGVIDAYIKEEQKNTEFNLKDRIKHFQNRNKLNNDIIVEFDCKKLNANNFQHLVNLSEIIQSSGEIGEFGLDIFNFKIKSLKNYEKELILRK
jgi:hypothetical protein